MRPYEYHPLGCGYETRVLALHPGHISARLRCDLLDAKIGEAEYEAVSYAWGEPNFSSILLCDSDDTYLRITPNVEALLRALRSDSRMRYFWVDMVCINQQDSQEKTGQVERMSSIYKHAAQVVIWLGEHGDGGREVFSFLREVREHTWGFCDATVEPVALGKIKEAAMNCLGTDDMECVRMFFQRPWFKRRWVIQEVALAAKATVVCGPFSMDFSPFMEAAMLLDSDFNNGDWATSSDLQFIIDHDTIGVIQSLRWVRSMHSIVTSPRQDIYSAILSARSFGLPILLLMERFHATKCTLDQDRIYALLGVGDCLAARRPSQESKEAEHAQLQIAVDYNRNLTAFFVDFALAVLKFMDNTCQDSFNLLHCAGSFRPPNLDNHCLPSWVPDWRASRLYESLLDIEPCFDDSRGTARQKPGVNIERRSLNVDGWVFSRISAGSSPASRNPSTQQLIQLVRDWWDFCAPSIVRRYPAASKTQHVGYFANTLSAGRRLGSNFSGAFSEKRQASVFTQFVAVILEGVCRDETPFDRYIRRCWGEESDESTGPMKPLDISQLSKHYLRLLNRIMGGRSIFMTENHHFGLCPGDAHVGDVVAVFHSASTPFVLRPQGKAHIKSQGTYRLVGDCFVEGIMNSKMVMKLGPKDYTFVIS